ncbi:MAG: ribbon-helix-helix protein, CopG family [Actinobacteria bacterium]|nr:ribbon-helix-helix protein, CopG family [Actinomycetota bacterium]
MKRTTIKISEELDTKLRHIAAQRDGTLSEVIREALEFYANGDGKRRRFLSAGAGAGDGNPVASRVEEILAEEWSEVRRS